MNINEMQQPATEVSAEPEKVILPFEANQEYFVEPLGELKAKPVYTFCKRLLDIVVSLSAFVILLIPMILLGVLVWCTSKGPALYSQERLGMGGKTFKLMKFRTMVADAEKDGAQWSGGDQDARITKVGSFLRKTRLDELPQLWNILVGDMSLVGPRPERAVFYDKFETYVHGFRQRLVAKPGLTGLAQVNGGYYLRPEEKIVYDMEYIRTCSFWLDLKIIFKTVAVVFTHDGAK